MPYILPTPEPQRRWYNDVGESQGITANLLIKALLAQMGAGGGPFAPKNIPNPNYGSPNQLGSGVQLSQGGLPPLAPQGRPQITQSPYSTQPMLNQQQFKTLADMQALQQSKAQTALTQRAASGQVQFYVDPSTGQATPLLPTTRGSIPIQPSQVPLVSVNPMTGEAIQSGMVSRNAKVVSSPAVTPEKAQALSALDSMMSSIDAMESALQADPSHLLKSSIPFMDRDFRAITDQFDKEAAIAAGGKQLTQTELNLIRSTRPTIQDIKSPEAIQRKINKLRQIATNAKSRLETGKPASSPNLEPDEQDIVQRLLSK